MAQKPTAKKAAPEDPRYTQALQSYESGLRAMQEHKFDKAKPHFQKVIAGPSKELADRASVHLNTSTISWNAPPPTSSRRRKSTTITPSR
jgi:hypothetical protein